jgi:hypothetical protein
LEIAFPRTDGTGGGHDPGDEDAEHEAGHRKPGSNNRGIPLSPLPGTEDQEAEGQAVDGDAVGEKLV